MNDSEQTLGQRRVKAEFNPAKDGLVDKIKNKSAELIDLLETMRSNKEPKEDENGMLSLVGNTDKDMYIDKAQIDIETACMYAVKANFTA